MNVQKRDPIKRIVAFLLVLLLSASALGSTALAAPASSLPGGHAYGYNEAGYDGYIWQTPQTSAYSSYFYNQLTDFEKAVYASIDEKTDTPSATADFTGANAIVFHRLGAPGITELHYSFLRAFDAFLLDNPQKHWVQSSGVKDLTIGIGGATTSVSFKITPAYNSALYTNTQAKINSLVSAATGTTNADKLWNLYVALAHMADYNTAAAKQGANYYPDAFAISGLGKDGKVVCEGYAKAFKTVCDKIGIPCVLVPGVYEGTENHMWVMAKVGSAWYAIDPTHGDQTSGPMRSTFLAGAKTSITGFGDSFVFENHYSAIRSNVFIKTYNCAGFSWPALAQQAYGFTAGQSGSTATGGGGGFGGASASNVPGPAPVTTAQAAAAAKTAAEAAKTAGSSTANVKLKNPGQIDNAALLAITGAMGTSMNATILADSLREDGKSVVVRITLDAAKATATTGGTPGTTLNLAASVTSAAAARTERFFTKYFSNSLRVVALEQEGSFGQDVSVAVKLDLTGMDTKNLFLYTYNAKTNAYKPIANANCRMDDTGYLHFTTPSAGSIVISSGPLKLK